MLLVEFVSSHIKKYSSLQIVQDSFSAIKFDTQATKFCIYISNRHILPPSSRFYPKSVKPKLTYPLFKDSG